MVILKNILNNFSALIFASALFLLMSCSEEKYAHNCDSSNSGGVLYSSDVITRSCVNEPIETLINTLQDVNDSISHSSSDRSEKLSVTKEELGVVFFAAADAKGFVEGARRGWENGKGLGKFTNAALFGTIYAASYSLAYFVATIIGDAFNIHYAPCIIRSTDIVLGDPEILRYTRNMLNDFDIRYNDDDLEIIMYSCAHNLILQRINDSVTDTALPNTYNIISHDQISYLKSENFVNDFSDICDEIKSLSSLKKHHSNELGTDIFNKYLQGIVSIKENDNSIAISKIETLCFKYCEIIKQSSLIDEEMKNDLLMSFYVAPFSANYWNLKLNVNEKI